MNMKMLKAVLTALAFAASNFANAGLIYATTGAGDSPSSLYSIDSITGNASLIGSTGFTGITAIDINPLTGDLFGIANDNAGNGKLVSIDKTSGSATFIANVEHGFVDMSFNSSGVLYGYGDPDESADDIFTINLQTGAVTLVGYPGHWHGAAIAFNLNDELIGKSSNAFYNVNSSNGTSQFHTNALGDSLRNALEYDSSGNLWSWTRNGALALVDLNTSSVTTVGNANLTIAALTAVTQTQVPEPSTLAIFALSMMGLASRRFKKQ